MLDAVVLKGTGMVLMREDWNGYGTAGCRRYRVSRVLLHSTTPVSLDWHGCACVWAACLQAGQWGNRLLSTLGREIWKCLERRRGEEGGKQSRTEGLSGLSRGEWGAWRRVERDWGTEKKRHLQSHYRFVLQLATLFIADICVQYTYRLVHLHVILPLHTEDFKLTI